MLNKFFALCLTFYIVLSPAHADELNDKSVATVMQNIVGQFIRPGYANFLKASNDLQNQMAQLCQSPNQSNLEESRSAFSKTATAWASIEIVRFGPVMRDNRLERILFYPDRKSTGLRQVQRLLATKDTSAVDVNSLSEKSVAVQGLGAIEFILFGTGSHALANEDEYRCKYGAAVAQNLTSIGQTLVDGWSKNAKATGIWTNPSEDNPVLRNSREAVNEILGTMVHGLEAVRDIRIGAFLRENVSKDRPRSALFRRSENTIPVIAANISSVEALLTQSNAGLLLSDENQVVLNNVLFQLNDAKSTVANITMPVPKALKDKTLRSKLEYLKLSLKFAITQLDEDFAKAIGISSGFSFSDGD